jgi:thioesterase domain-containing protein
MLFRYSIEGRRRPLVLLHGDAGVLPYHRGRLLAEFLGPDQPIYAIEAPGFDGTRLPCTSVHDAAREYVADLRRAGLRGPLAVAGVCGGSLVAFQIAQQLAAEAQFAGEPSAAELLLMIDPPGLPGGGVREEKFRPEVVGLLREQAKTWLLSLIERKEEGPVDLHDPAQLERAIEIGALVQMSISRYFAAAYAGRVEVLAIEKRAQMIRRSNWPWQNILTGPWNLTPIACEHTDLFSSKRHAVFEWIKAGLEKAPDETRLQAQGS